ncbi:MAG TPA: choice-of-anchor B family protein [Saprospiraceae bacterium]|nr:choice-of-anchor B family protein [Saprospiraceae bacterium]
MIKTITSLLLCFTVTYQIFGQNFNLELQSNILQGEDCSDVWGFVDSSGIEYAVIGTRSSAKIYSLEDPKNPILRYTAPGARSIWRDMKFYNNHIYVTQDQDTFGLTIIDVSQAPDSISHTQWKPQLTIGNNNARFLRAHNLYIDEKGFAYISGHNLSRRGVMILDLNVDPKEPILVSAVDGFYSHDAYVQDDILYSSELSNGFGIYDVSNKFVPIELGRGRSGNNFTHNAWLSDSTKILFTTDEVASGYVESYDVSDPANIKYLDRYKTNAGNTRVIPHNAHVKGDYVVTSWYTDGVIINDVSDPSNIVKVGGFDTYTGAIPASGSLFLGCWGAYPFLPSGLILASDINTGLYVFKPTYVKAAYLTGNIYEREKGSTGPGTPLTGARVQILQSDVDKFLNDNQYKLGITPDSIIQVVFKHPNYPSDTIEINLSAGTTDTFDYYFEREIMTDVEDLNLKPSIYLFPTATTDQLTIVGDVYAQKYEVINLAGALIQSGVLKSNNLEVRNLPSGYYFLKIKIESEFVVMPFYKE